VVRYEKRTTDYGLRTTSPAPRGRASKRTKGPAPAAPACKLFRRQKVARYRDAKCRLCRREGAKLFLKGERCFKPSCAIEKRGATPPGQHGRDTRRTKV